MSAHEGFVLEQDAFVKLLNVEDALTSGSTPGYLPADGSYQDVSDFERFAFLIGVGGSSASSSAMAFQVMQSTLASGSAGSQKVITGASGSHASTVQDKYHLIEVETAQLDINNDFRYVSLRTTGEVDSTKNYASIWFIGLNPGKKPVSQSATKQSAAVVAG